MNVTATEIGRLEGKRIAQITFNKEVCEIIVADDYGEETLRIMKEQDGKGLKAIIY